MQVVLYHGCKMVVVVLKQYIHVLVGSLYLLQENNTENMLVISLNMYEGQDAKPLKFAGVPQTTGSISAASEPKFTILCGHLEEILLLIDDMQ